jgi:hypothetical protein
VESRRDLDPETYGGLASDWHLHYRDWTDSWTDESSDLIVIRPRSQDSSECRTADRYGGPRGWGRTWLNDRIDNFGASRTPAARRTLIGMCGRRWPPAANLAPPPSEIS